MNTKSGCLALAIGAIWVAASATAGVVDSDIEENTVWALADSPFTVIEPITLVEGATLDVESGAVVQLETDAVLTVAGELTASAATFNLAFRSDIIVSGHASFTGCDFDGTTAISNLEDLVFGEGSTGELLNCRVHDVNIVIASQAVTLLNGAMENTNGAVVHLDLTDADAPTITGVDFSEETDWLNVSDVGWFVDELNASLTANISDNTFADSGAVSLGAGVIDTSFHFARFVPFSGATVYSWEWAGGSVAAGVTVTVERNVALALTNNVDLAGDFVLGDGAHVTSSRSLAMGGDVTIGDGAVLELIGTSATVEIPGNLTVNGGGEARLAGTTTVSGTVTVASNARLALEAMRVAGEGALTLAAGAIAEVGFPGLTIEGAMTATGATLNFALGGDLLVAGTFNATDSIFNFHKKSDLSVREGGVFLGDSCVFNGFVDPANEDDLIFEAGSGGGLTDCTVHDLNVILASSEASIEGGLMENSDGPVLRLLPDSGPAPEVAGVDFSQDLDWLYVEHVPWFLMRLDTSLAENIINNTFPGAAVITLGPTAFNQDFVLRKTLPFSGATEYVWRWAGASVAAGTVLTVPEGLELSVEGALTVAGTLEVEAGGYVEGGGNTTISGLMQVTGEGEKSTEPQVVFTFATSVPGELAVTAGAIIEVGTLTVEEGGLMTLEDGAIVNINFAGITVNGQLDATDGLLRFLESGNIIINGTCTLTESVVDIFSFNDVEVFGSLDATGTNFEGARHGNNPDSLILHAGSDCSFDLCEFLNLTVEAESVATFDRCEFTNPDGDGVVARGNAYVVLSRSNFPDFLSDAVEIHDNADVVLSSSYWGAPDGPSGPAFPGSGHSINGAATLLSFVAEELIYAPPSILSHTPDGTVGGPIGFVEFTFDDAIDPATFAPGDIVMTGPQGAVAVATVEDLGSHVWRASFPEQTVSGVYTFDAGPAIANPGGYELDQDGDGIGGEAQEDVYHGAFTLGYAPEAAFSTSATEICVGNSVSFTDESENIPTEWLWGFGDGETSAEAVTAHAYQNPGVYTVSLTVRNAIGEDSHTEPDLVVVGEAPVAGFRASQTQGDAPLVVVFTDLSVGSPETWTWDFGDGGSSLEPSPSYTYQTGGTYTVALTVANRCGENTLSRSAFVVVHDVEPPPAPAGIEASDGTDCDAVHVSWEAVTRATSYTVYRDDAFLATVTGTAYTDTTAVPGAEYLYTVAASNAAGEGERGAGDTGWRGAPGPAAANLSASDGNPANLVRITWDAMDGAQSYQVYRSISNDEATAILISAVLADTTYDDVTAAAPTVTPGQGCFAEDVVTFAVYYYWVTTLYECGESALGTPDTGYRGLAQRKAGDLVYPPVLPAAWADRRATARPLPAMPLISPGAELAVRLVSDAAIDPASVWGVVATAGGGDGAVRWAPMSASDGWVVYTPEAAWTPGEEITLSAGANTMTGAAISPVSYSFEVAQSAPGPLPIWQPGEGDLDTSQLDLGPEGISEAVLGEIEAPALAGGVGPAYAIAPERLFDTPQRLWIPIPEGADATTLALYYYLPSGDGADWYPAIRVAGWLAPESELIVSIDGTTYLGYAVRHGATVQLGMAPETGEPEVAGLALVMPHQIGDVAVLVAIGLVLLAGGRRATVCSRRRTYRAR